MWYLQALTVICDLSCFAYHISSQCSIFYCKAKILKYSLSSRFSGTWNPSGHTVEAIFPLTPLFCFQWWRTLSLLHCNWIFRKHITLYVIYFLTTFDYYRKVATCFRVYTDVGVTIQLQLFLFVYWHKHTSMPVIYCCICILSNKALCCGLALILE